MDRRQFLKSIPGSVLASAVDARSVLGAVASAAGAGSGRSLGAADRRARLARHVPVVRAFDPWSPLSLGNGGFAFTADATGLQTFPELYTQIPLATQAEWGWHSFPDHHGYRLSDAMVAYDAHGRRVPYASGQSTPAGEWLRQNPHRLGLGRIGFVLRRRDGTLASARDVEDIEQRLDLWTGSLDSRFRLDGVDVRVRTLVHPDRDLVAVRVSAGDALPALALRLAFPYATGVHTGDPCDWTAPERHRTGLVREGRGEAVWARSLDGTVYQVAGRWSDASLRREAEHAFLIEPAGASFELVVGFSPTEAGRLPSFDESLEACAAHWERFWLSGGVVDLSGSADPRATELERRIVLSEYLTAIQCAGTMPPQETGETFDSWYGKFHLEMHWWHAAHFALWGRVALLERSLPWYRHILPMARETARMQGYAGARWPKMVGPDGRESPSSVGVFLIWQQPHPIYLAELVYRARPGREVLEAYRELVSESAAFMASYPAPDAASGRLMLGPPLIPAQEIHPPERTFNPMFELAYWRYGLQTAQRWRERLGLPREPAWEDVVRRLAPLPMRDGLYVNAASAPDTFSDPGQRRDHPTLVGAFGFVPSDAVDREAMRRTLRRVLESWQWDETWGWDYPLLAMTAARLGERDLAVDALLMDTPRNRYLPNGHNYQRPGLSIYLPGNGGLLAAVAMMARGWDGLRQGKTSSGAYTNGPAAPGFPDHGWTVRWENLLPMV